jgi:GNAT superfamily N-acetyltransferase
MARVFVSMDGDKVAGYYALATGGVDPEHAPPRVRKGVPRHPVPVVILARLAVDERYQGLGLGRALVRDALLRVLNVAEEVGVRALLVHAKDESAKEFYLAFGEFEESPTDPMHLFLLIKDLRLALA